MKAADRAIRLANVQKKLVVSVRPEPRAEAPRISRTRSERLARQLALATWIERAVK